MAFKDKWAAAYDWYADRPFKQRFLIAFGAACVSAFIYSLVVG